MDTQRQCLEEIARRMMRALLDGKKSCGAATVAAPPRHNIWRQSWWDVIAAAAPAGLRLALTENGAVILGIANAFAVHHPD